MQHRASYELLLICCCSFAKAAKEDKSKWLDFTKGYFLKREKLVCVLLLVDATIPPQQVDLDCANWLAESEVGTACNFSWLRHSIVSTCTGTELGRRAVWLLHCSNEVVVMFSQLWFILYFAIAWDFSIGCK
jgi:hypothetical protein